jgi:hypothetical protein
MTNSNLTDLIRPAEGQRFGAIAAVVLGVAALGLLTGCVSLSECRWREEQAEARARLEAWTSGLKALKNEALNRDDLLDTFKGWVELTCGEAKIKGVKCEDERSKEDR